MEHEWTRYAGYMEDTDRWSEFDFDPGDIIISTRSKAGTTWTQMICALLVFQTPRLPAPLAELSPWVDTTIRPVEDVRAQLEAQAHRRFVKSHTPLDGIRHYPGVFYIYVGRDPRDCAVSNAHQDLSNTNFALLNQLLGVEGTPTAVALENAEGGPVDERSELLEWLAYDRSPAEYLDGLAGHLWHAADAWERHGRSSAAAGEGGVVILHYADLLADLEGEMRRLAELVGVEIPEERWPALVDAARFKSMKSQADNYFPDPVQGVLKDAKAFFRKGESGAGRALMTPEEIEAYDRRVAELAPADVVAWLHR